MPATSDELAGIDLIGDEGTYSAIDVLTTHGHSGCRPQTFAHNSPTKVVRRGAFSGWIGVQPDTAVVTPARQERKAMISEVEKRAAWIDPPAWHDPNSAPGYNYL
jgi:hypothetical protein